MTEHNQEQLVVDVVDRKVLDDNIALIDKMYSRPGVVVEIPKGAFVKEVPHVENEQE